jgi:hypothetical protein
MMEMTHSFYFSGRETMLHVQLDYLLDLIALFVLLSFGYHLSSDKSKKSMEVWRYGAPDFSVRLGHISIWKT